MKIGIFGRTKAIDKNINKKAEEIGRIIAKNNHIVVTGGTSGYPHTVAMSTIDADGKAISYAAGKSMADHSKFHNVNLSRYSKIIFQKNYFNKKLHSIDNYLRSLDMCLNVDMGIIIGGRVGTMYEVAILSGLAKDIFVLSESGGVTKNTIKNFKKEGHKEKSNIIFFKNPKELSGLLKKPIIQ